MPKRITITIMIRIRTKKAASPLAFRPWWGNWWPALVAFAVGFVVIGALAALRSHRTHAREG